MRRFHPGFARSILFALLFAIAGCNGSSNAARDRIGHDGDKGFLVKTVKRGFWTRKYGLFVPLSYHPGTSQKYPVIVFLHGLGEGDGFGEGDLKNMTVGLGPAVARKAEQFQFIVIFPQSAGSWDPNSEYVSDMFAALDQVCRQYPVDQDCIILTGVSTGGHGTWAIGARYPDRFAALVPMASNGSDQHDADNLTHTPVRAYCSTFGDLFAGWNDQSMVNRIKELNPTADAQFIATPTLGHDCWENVYGSDELFAWMRQQHRPAVGVPPSGGSVAVKTPPKLLPTPSPTLAAADPPKPVVSPAAPPRTALSTPAPASPRPTTAVPAPQPAPTATVSLPPRTIPSLITPPVPPPAPAPPSRNDGSWVNTSW